jgi:hypothetical protein
VDDVVTAAAVPSTGPLTIELWIQPAQNIANQVILAHTDDNTGWSLELNNGFLTFWLATNQGWRSDRLTTLQLQADQWYHVAATYDGNLARTFVQGLASGGTAIGTLTQGPALSLGGFPGYNYYDGLTDELRISNVVRYDGAYAIPTAPLAADGNTLLLWSMDSGSGQTVYDGSTNGNDGTLGEGDQVENSDPAWVPGYDPGAGGG